MVMRPEKKREKAAVVGGWLWRAGWLLECRSCVLACYCYRCAARSSVGSVAAQRAVAQWRFSFLGGSLAGWLACFLFFF